MVVYGKQYLLLVEVLSVWCLSICLFNAQCSSTAICSCPHFFAPTLHLQKGTLTSRLVSKIHGQGNICIGKACSVELALNMGISSRKLKSWRIFIISWHVATCQATTYANWNTPLMEHERIHPLHSTGAMSDCGSCPKHDRDEKWLLWRKEILRW